jgi:hypothetical protein
MIIGVCGLIGAGKDTIADYLVNVHEYRRESFANSLKDAVAQVFGWDRTMIEGRTKAAREWREQVDTWWAERLNMPDLTPRYILQHWGTNVLRQHFHDDIWIASLENKIRNSQDNIVISDCRFPNEIKAIKQSGGVVVRVQRGPEPDWMPHAINHMNGPKTIGWSIGKNVLEASGVHASEYSWAATDFDQILDNNGSMDQLYAQLNSLVQDLQASMVNHSD